MADGHSISSIIEFLADCYLKLPARLKNDDQLIDDTPKVAKPTIPMRDVVESSDPSQKVNKTLTPKTRREILNRDKCCQYKDPISGKVCGSAYFHQTDHKTSQWAGGTHEKSNLHVLCANHNRYKYQKESRIRFL